jgi:hypothetical protein
MTDGADLLDDVETFLSRFVAYPGDWQRTAHVLWVAHCWYMDSWDSTPRIAFLSVEPGSGKSRALEVTEPLVPRAVHAVNTSPAYLFRRVSDKDGRPTILFDEIDTVFGPKAKDNEEVRGMLNAGHRQGATAGRCVVKGNEITTEDLPAYCAVALAGLDDLPDTIMTRSVVVRMRRRAPGERIEPWRARINGPEGEQLGDRLAAWSNTRQHVDIDWPEMPEGVEDRNADVWEALIAVADLAGGRWPALARVTAVTAVTDTSEGESQSLGIQLLHDLRELFSQESTDRMSSIDIVSKLNNLDESPWGGFGEHGLDARGLARRLGKYGIRPTTHRFDGTTTAKGYLRADLTDAWTRYLPPVSRPEESVTAVTRSQIRGAVTAVTEVTDLWGDESEAAS